ncbi:hypothetical protein RhiirA4_439136 [Rhizophagus irregularis]|uniref:Ion transport domain-containing protein n=1 Tax=Rhizophagus irregularis TaxID=588596 RepID=A0A2I1FUN6_9GLOM|nr:hypothetical protein RhiirA4_439136 [Rhizophagus irregularis]
MYNGYFCLIHKTAVDGIWGMGWDVWGLPSHLFGRQSRDLIYAKKVTTPLYLLFFLANQTKDVSSYYSNDLEETPPNYKLKVKIKTVKNVANVFKNQVLNEEVYYGTDYASEKENYQIAICQNGKFAVTFDTANLRIKILENTDHRPFTSSKKKVNSNNKNEFDGLEKLDEQDDINQIIAYFKINDDFMVEKFYKENYNPPSSGHDTTATENKASNLKWSFDISNVQEKNGESFIFVAISRIADEDMRRTSKEKRKDRKVDNKKPDYERKVLSKIRYNCPLPPDEAMAVDMQNTQPELTSRNNSEIKKRIAIYRLDLKKNQGEKTNYILSTVTCHYSDQISGICRFIEASSEDDSESLYDFKLKRFIILNYRGIYNFEFDDHFDFFTLNEKFEYPASIRRELDSWYADDDCMKRLLSCIYDKYFLVTQYKNNAQSLEVYDLEKMELETTAKKLENKDKFVKKYNYDTFSVSRLQLCFTRGVNNIRLYYIENGLQVAKKKLEVDRIHLLEFIENDEKLLIIGESPKEGKDPEGEKELKTMVWDLYDTGKVESIKLNIPMDIIENLGTRLARTSGNILQIGDDGKVSSVLKKIEKELKKKKKNEKKVDKEKTDKITDSIKKLIVKKPDGEPDENHNIYYDQKYINFKPIVDEKEPWVLGDYDRHSYCLYHNRKETEVETLQLIVGRSTVQIWHQIQDKKNKDDLPNKGEPFLEYIWTNRIPINQEREETKLRIEYFKYGSNVGLHEKLDDFHLKVYWYERKDNEENSKKEEHAKKKEREITKEAEDEISKIEDEIKGINEDGNMDETEKEKRRLEIINNSVKVKRKEKVIKLKYIIEKFHAVTHACRALEHLNKRYKNKRLANNYTRAHKYEEIITYVKHIVWRFAKNEPENFRLLDVRRNIMKSLILGDCDYLIKFILFGDDEEINENKNGCKEKEKEKRQKEDEIREDDLDFDERNDKLEDNETIVPENIMELAIYHCKGRELNDTIMIAYLLEFYSRHATDCAGWMCTVSKAIPLLFKYNYDDYARKLFFKECFAVQDHFSAQEPDEIIPTEYLARRNHDIKFRAFKPLVKLETDKYEVYVKIVNPIKNFKNIIFKIYENFDNDLGKSPLALRVVPLPGFTKNNIGKKKAEYGLLKIILNLFWIIFLPRWFVLLRNPANIKTKESTYSGNATNVTTNETLHVELKSDFDPKSSDNPFSTFSDSLMAAYFWMGGNWVQRDDFDFWAIDIFTFVASIFLVIVLQNMLIAFMSGVFERAEIKGRQTLLRHRANHIVDYEALHHIHLWNLEPEPKHIYYFGQSKTLEEWYATRKSEQGAIYKDFEEKSTFTKLTFKGRCYDKRSIWEYVDKNLKMEKINMKNYLNDIIEWLIKYHKDQNNEKEINIESINEIIKEVENMKLNDVKKYFYNT